MPLNYSKWDNLELSDDSDIEGHPNVDKKSLIKWKQRDIHEKREIRKQRIAQLEADIACNDVLALRLVEILASVKAKGRGEFSSLVERFKTNPSPDKPPTNAPNQKTYDEMLLSLMLQVHDEAKQKGVDKDGAKLDEYLVNGLEDHVKQLAEHQEKQKKDLAFEIAEQKKKITSDDIHDGFDSHHVTPKHDPAPIPHTIGSGKTTTKFETLNPKGVASARASQNAASSSKQVEESDEDNELPRLTQSLAEFSQLPLHGYEKSWEFIKGHRDVVVPGASDALLVAAFEAESEGKKAYAKKCVHQSLLLQYCDKLGRDGVAIFFRKMVSGDPRALVVFEKDVEDTYKHLVERVRISKAEAAAAPTETIQLVPEDPSHTISFNVPDGPPPENLILEGPGTEDMDIEQVRKALQMRWDIFQGFSKDMQEALKSGGLDAVNKVLGNMNVSDAEEIVRLLDVGGILNFSEGGIRDETGQGQEDTEDEDESAQE